MGNFLRNTSALAVSLAAVGAYSVHTSEKERMLAAHASERESILAAHNSEIERMAVITQQVRNDAKEAIGVLTGKVDTLSRESASYREQAKKAEQTLQKRIDEERRTALTPEESIDLLRQHVDELKSKVRDLPRLQLPPAEVHALIMENMAELKGVAEVLRDQKMKLAPPGTPAHDLGVLAWQVPADSEAQYAYKCAKNRTRVFCGNLKSPENKIWIHQLFLRAEGSLQEAIFFEAVRPELERQKAQKLQQGPLG